MLARASRVWVVALLLQAMAPVQAAAPVHYVLDPASSVVEFEFTQAGARSKGRFHDVGTVLEFAPEAVAVARLAVTIGVASLDTADAERDATLRSSDFFAVKAYPQATFTALRIVRTAAGYEASGKLSMRGVTRDVRVPFTFRTATEQGRSVGYLLGATTLRRLDFGVGQGDWQSTEWVANEVTVTYKLKLAAAK